jgi:hypothetical protein
MTFIADQLMVKLAEEIRIRTGGEAVARRIWKTMPGVDTRWSYNAECISVGVMVTVFYFSPFVGCQKGLSTAITSPFPGRLSERNSCCGLDVSISAGCGAP